MRLYPRIELSWTMRQVVSHFGFHWFIHRPPKRSLHCCLLRLCPPIYPCPGSSNTFSHLTWAYAHPTWMMQLKKFSESLLLVPTPNFISRLPSLSAKCFIHILASTGAKPCSCHHQTFLSPQWTVPQRLYPYWLSPHFTAQYTVSALGSGA